MHHTNRNELQPATSHLTTEPDQCDNPGFNLMPVGLPEHPEIINTYSKHFLDLYL